MCITTITAGYLCCLVFILLQPIARQISRNLQGQENEVQRIAVEDVWNLFAGTSVITVWHGFWNLFFVLGDHFPILYKGKDVTSLVAHVISFALLALANISMSLPGKGVSIDGSSPDGEGMECSVDYLCEYFRSDLETEEIEKLKPKKPEQKTKPIAKVTGKQIINGTPTTRQRIINQKYDEIVKDMKSKDSAVDKSNNNMPRGKKKEL